MELSDQGLQLFRLLVIEELPAAEVGTITGLSADAVYTWRHRLLRRTRQLLVEFSSVPDSGSADPIPHTKEPRPQP
jgi:DNA-directed RNA polymerase specialized sigma24 family protein